MGKKVLVPNTDRGSEYVNEKFFNHLALQGTTRKLSVHDAHEHSGITERRNHTIQEHVPALLHASQLNNREQADPSRILKRT